LPKPAKQKGIFERVEGNFMQCHSEPQSPFADFFLPGEHFFKGLIKIRRGNPSLNLAYSPQSQHDFGNIYPPWASHGTGLAHGTEPWEWAFAGRFYLPNLEKAKDPSGGMGRFESHRAPGRAPAALDTRRERGDAFSRKNQSSILLQG